MYIKFGRRLCLSIDIDDRVDGKRFPELKRQSLRYSESRAYLMDINSVYKIYYDDDKELHLIKLPNADQSSFHEMAGMWAKDDKHVYFSGDVVIDADPNTFEVMGNLSGRDKAGEYREGKLYCRFNEAEKSDLPTCTSAF